MAATKSRTRVAKKWTFMVYMAGDNNLESAGEDDLAEMKKVGSSDQVNLVAQFDRGKTRGSTRYYLRPATTLKSDAIATLGVKNTGDPAGLIDFVRFATAKYPATHYALILWNHGQGWDDTDIYAGERAGGRTQRARRVLHPKHLRRALFRTSVQAAARLSHAPGGMARAILLDDGAKDFLDNLEMKKVLTAARDMIGHPLDLLGMDACLMSMAEVGYQSRGSVSYTVGSEETEPGDGWPYTSLLRKLVKSPDTGADAFGRVIVSDYVASYRNKGEAVTQSLCDVGGVSKVASAVKALAGVLTQALSSEAAVLSLLAVRNRVQQYEVRDNVDLIDLCRLLRAARSLPAAIKPACDAVLSAANAYVLQSGYIGSAMSHSNGVAIYFPSAQVSVLYKRLDWAKVTGWGRFLSAYLDAVQSR